MIWAFDLDGVITANPDFFKWFTYNLKKKGNDNDIHIVTARNPGREIETLQELMFWGIAYDELHMMDKKLKRDYKTQGEWKNYMVKIINADIWFDNDFKVYEKVCGVKLDAKAERITI